MQFTSMEPKTKGKNIPIDKFIVTNCLKIS